MAVAAASILTSVLLVKRSARFVAGRRDLHNRSGTCCEGRMLLKSRRKMGSARYILHKPRHTLVPDKDLATNLVAQQGGLSTLCGTASSD